MERRDAPTFQTFLNQWRRSKLSARAILETEDGRWALVSTSVTALVAGTIAWLAAGAVPHTAAYSHNASRDRSLLPYQVFMRLASRGSDARASYASIGPAAALTSKPAVTDVTPPASLDNALMAESLNGDDDIPTDIDTHTITLESGDTLVGALTDAGVSADDANAAVLALRDVYNPRALRAGQTFQLSFAPTGNPAVARITYSPPNQAGDTDSAGNGQPQSEAPSRLLSISFSPSIDHDVTVSRATDGSFNAKDTEKELVARYHRAGGTIDSSLYLAAMQAGIPAEAVVQMIHIFSYQVDFQRDIHPGDKFQVLYSYYYTKDGKPAKQGVIDFASMTLGGKTYTLYRYTPKGSDSADYLDGKGRSAKSLLMKTPVDGARISSTFGMRYHPVLGYSRMHKGVDFAVPVGTPVMAAGSGVIKFEGRARGYGNFLMIKHNSEYTTAYGHLSRFAKGLHDGSHVHQGQIVAYSGNTGLTTGPHLHYEVRDTAIRSIRFASRLPGASSSRARNWRPSPARSITSTTNWRPCRWKPRLPTIRMVCGPRRTEPPASAPTQRAAGISRPPVFFARDPVSAPSASAHLRRGRRPGCRNRARRWSGRSWWR